MFNVDDGLPSVKRSALAQFFAVTPRTVSNWIERGCPVAERFLKSRNVRGFKIEDVAGWLFGNGNLSLEDSYSLMVKLELNCLGDEVARRMPAFLDAMTKDPGYEHDPEAVQYGINLAIFMLVCVVNSRTEDDNVYFEPFPEA